MNRNIFLIFSVLIIILIYLSYPKFVDEKDITDSYKSKLILREYSKVFDMIYKDIGYYPDSTQGFLLIYDNVINAEGWKGPYLGKRLVPVDAWGQNLVYHYPKKCEMKRERADYDLYSIGPNGEDECGRGDDIKK